MRALSGEPFRIEEGAEVFIVYSPDSARQFLNDVQSSGYPLKVLEVHSKDDERAVVTLFSYRRGMRFVVAFKLEDARGL